MQISDIVTDAAEKYDESLKEALQELVQQYPPKEGNAEDLWNADAPYLVFMTLSGAGVGIFDEWERFYDYSRLVSEGDVNKFLTEKLQRFVDITGGGLLNDVFDDVAGDLSKQQSIEQVKNLIDQHPQAYVEDVMSDDAGRELLLVVLNDNEKKWTEMIPADMESARRLLRTIGEKPVVFAQGS